MICRGGRSAPATAARRAGAPRTVTPASGRPITRPASSVNPTRMPSSARRPSEGARAVGTDDSTEARRDQRTDDDDQADPGRVARLAAAGARRCRPVGVLAVPGPARRGGGADRPTPEAEKRIDELEAKAKQAEADLKARGRGGPGELPAQRDEAGGRRRVRVAGLRLRQAARRG